MRPFSEYVERGPLATEQLVPFARALVEAVVPSHLEDAWRGDLTGALVRWDGAAAVELPATPGRLRLDALDVEPSSVRGGDALATFGYLAPEQCGGGEPSPRSDVFQIGVLLFEASTGEHPFADARGDQIVDNVLSYEPKPPGHLREELALEWDGIVACCLHKVAEQRFASALDVLAQIEKLERSGGTARRKHRELRRGRVAAAALVLVLAVAAVLWLTGVL